MPKDQSFEKLLPFTVTGHRAERGNPNIPENSLKAFVNTYNQRVRGHETDVQLCLPNAVTLHSTVDSDDPSKALVLFHDSEDDNGLNDTTNVQDIIDANDGSEFTEKLKKLAAGDPRGEGRVYLSDLTFEESRRLRLTTIDEDGNRKVTDEQIPTLEEALLTLDDIRTPDDGYQLSLELKRLNVFDRDESGKPIELDLGDGEEREGSLVVKGKRFKTTTRSSAKRVSELLNRFVKASERKAQWSLAENFIISSFDKNLLAEMQAVDRSIPLRALFSEMLVARDWWISPDGNMMQMKVGDEYQDMRPVLPIDALISPRERIWDLCEDELIKEIDECLAKGINQTSIAISIGQLTPRIAEYIKSREYVDPVTNERKPLEICLWTANEPPIKDRPFIETLKILEYVEEQGISTFITDYGRDMAKSLEMIAEFKRIAGPDFSPEYILKKFNIDFNKNLLTIEKQFDEVMRSIDARSTGLSELNEVKTRVEVKQEEMEVEATIIPLTTSQIEKQELYKQIYELDEYKKIPKLNLKESPSEAAENELKLLRKDASPLTPPDERREWIKKIESLLSDEELDEEVIDSLEPEVANVVLDHFARVKTKQFSESLNKLSQDQIISMEQAFGPQRRGALPEITGDVTVTRMLGQGWLGIAYEAIVRAILAGSEQKF